MSVSLVNNLIRVVEDILNFVWERRGVDLTLRGKWERLKEKLLEIRWEHFRGALELRSDDR